MFETDLKDILKHQYVVEELDQGRVQEMSNLLADPMNSITMIRSKSFEGEQGGCNLEDPWYATKYSKERYSDDLLDVMKHPSKLIPDGKVGLPPPNNLLPKNLDLVPEDSDF